MQWQDEAIILGVKRHGETSVIAEVMTRTRGRHLGMVRSGRSRSMQPVLQAGNLMQTDQLLAGVVILSVFGLAVGKLIGWLETWLLHWR